MSLYIEQPIIFYDQNIHLTINNYMINYQKKSAFFYYFNTRVYINKLPTLEWLNFRDNWKALNKSQILFYFLQDKPSEENFQSSNINKYQQSISTFYLPFNFCSRGVVFTNNSGFTRAANGKNVQVFCVGKKILSTINAALPANAYTNPTVTSGYTLENKQWSPKFEDEYNNDQQLVDPSTIYNIIEPTSFDQVILFPTGYLKNCNIREYPYGKDNIYVGDNNFIYDIEANVKFLSLECVRFTQNYSKDTTLQLTFENNTKLYNILVAQTPIIGNNSLSYIEGTTLNPTNDFQNFKIITGMDLIMGDVNLNDGQVSVSPSTTLAYYVYYSPFENDNLSTTTSNFNFSRFRTAFKSNSYFQSSLPIKGYCYEPAQRTWVKLGDIAYNEDIILNGSKAVFIFDRASFVYANVPAQNSFTYFSMVTTTSQNNSKWMTPRMQGDPLLVKDFSVISDGVYFAEKNNMLVFKMVNFDELFFPEAQNQPYPYGNRYNDNYLTFYLETSGLASNFLSTYGVDDNSFESGIRQDVRFYNYKEQLSISFCAKITISFDFKNDSFILNNQTKWYETRISYALPSTFGIYKYFRMNIMGKDTEDLVMASTISETQRNTTPVSYISNKNSSFAFTRRIFNQQNFKILINRKLSYDTLFTCSIQFS